MSALTSFTSFFTNILIGLYRWVAHLPLGTIRQVVIFLDLLLILTFTFLWFECRRYRPVFYMNPRKHLPKKSLVLEDPSLKEAWALLKARGEKAVPQSLTLAIVEADTFVDSILKRLNLQGEHMADRLDQLGSENLKTLDRLWKAHRVRNDLVHTPGFVLTPTDARRIISDYEAFLVEINVLDQT